MIIDSADFSRLKQKEGTSAARAIASFLELVQKKTGAKVVADKRDFPFGKPQLAHHFRLAQAMFDAEIVTSVHPVQSFPDEPRLKQWVGTLNTSPVSNTSGASFNDDGDALAATLAEALERYIWREETDYFQKLLNASTAQLKRQNISHIAPEAFASYSVQQRTSDPKRYFDENTQFTWVRGTSLVTNTTTYVPAQIVSGVHRKKEPREPLIRPITTNGLATWPTQAGARLAGMLEPIERDAYMIMWLNQLTLPRLSLTSLSARFPALAEKIEYLKRYGLEMHVVSMITDAPTHAICTVLEDTTGRGPRFSLGLRAHRSLEKAVEKSTFEALRARGNMRARNSRGVGVIEASAIDHFERYDYWADRANAKKLAFLIAGEMRDMGAKPWDGDSEAQHLQRLVHWCKDTRMECIAVPLTHSKKNVSDFHIEMIVMPSLHPLHLSEKDRMFGGERWKTVTKMFGYTPRDAMFFDEPHPFA